MLKLISLALAFVIVMTGVSLSAPGDLDPSFGNNGSVTYNTGTDDWGNSVAIQSDGKLIVAGEKGRNGLDDDVLILRYNTDGTLDSTFGSGGVVTYDSGAPDFGFGLIVQSDGKIVVTGITNNGSDYDVLILRYNTNGILDSTFGSGGVVTYDSGSHDFSAAAALQADGKIVVAGRRYDGINPASNDVLVLRYNSDGTLDNTFNENGIVTYNGGGPDVGKSVAIQTDGKIVVAGYSYGDVLVLRYGSDGLLDNTFGTNGIAFYDSGYIDEGNGVAIQTNGKILVAGSSFGRVLLLRYNSDGTLDDTFGGDGVVTYNGSPNGDDVGWALATQSDGKVIIAGDTYNGANSDVLLLRYNSDGTLDDTFSGDGVVKYNGPANSYDQGYAVAIQSDGKIAVTGHSDNGSDQDIFVLRVIGLRPPNISLDPASFNFGDIIAGGSSAQTFTVSNTGDLELHIGMISLTGIDISEFDIQDDTCSGQILMPLTNCTVHVGFSPTSAGQKSANLTIPSDDPDMSTVEAPLSGTGIYTQVLLLSPSGGEVIPAGSAYNIRWGAPGTATKFKLKYSLDDGLTWRSAHPGLPFVTGGSYPWKVPTSAGNQLHCSLKVIGFTADSQKIGADTSDGSFTIEVVRLTSPNGGELFTTGEQRTITWTTSPDMPAVSRIILSYSVDNGVTWKKIVTSSAPTDDGSFVWPVPPVAKEKKKCKVKIVLKDVSGKTLGSDKSDAVFSMRPAL